MKPDGMLTHDGVLIPRSEIAPDLRPCIYCDVTNTSPIQRWEACCSAGRCWDRFEGALHLGSFAHSEPPPVVTRAQDWLVCWTLIALPAVIVTVLLAAVLAFWYASR